MLFLITTLPADPHNLRPAKYSFKRSEGKFGRVEMVSALPFSLLKKHFSPDHSFVLAFDSFFSTPPEAGARLTYFAHRQLVGEEVARLLVRNHVFPAPSTVIVRSGGKEVFFHNDENYSFEQLRKEKLFQCCYSPPSGDVLSSLRVPVTSVNLVVLPSVGRRVRKNEKEWVFNSTGCMTDAYVVALKELVDYFTTLISSTPRLKEGLKSGRRERLTFVCDLSHASECMGVFTLRALEKITEVLAAFFDVEFQTFSSEPIAPGLRHQELRIHEVERKKVPVQYPGTFFNPEEFLLVGETEEVDAESEWEKVISSFEKSPFWSHSYRRRWREYEKFCEFLNRFRTAVGSAIPIGVFDFFPEPPLLARVIKHFFKLYTRGFEVLSDRANGRLEVNSTRRFSFNAANFEILLTTYLISYLLSLFGVRQGPASLKGMKRFVSTFYSQREAVRTIIGKELDKSTKRFRKVVRNDEWKPICYSARRQMLEQGESRSLKRNFFAHAGFEMSIVDWRTEGGQVLFRFSPDRSHLAQRCLDDVWRKRVISCGD